MKVRTVCESRSYSVELTVNQFLKVERKDDKCKGNDFGLMTLLEKLGCYSIEYNGHFGSFIYYTLSASDDTEALRQTIEQTIVKYAS